MRLEFEPNASALPFVETESAAPGVSGDLDKLLRDGVKAAQEGKRAEARTLLLRVTEADADNENAWLWLASISEYPEELLVFLNNVLRVNPENERALEWHRATRSLLAKTLVQRGVDALREDRADFAKQCFEQAIGHEADSELAWLWLASVAETEEDKAACFEKVVAINPENETAKSALDAMSSAKTNALFSEALKAAFDGNHIFALEAVATVLARDAHHLDSLTLKAHIAPTFEERAESCLKIREIDPENAFAKSYLASWRALSELLPEETVAEVKEIEEVRPAEAIAEEPVFAEAPEAAAAAEVEEPAAPQQFAPEFSAYPQSVELEDFQPAAEAAEEVQEVQAAEEIGETPKFVTDEELCEQISAVAPQFDASPSFDELHDSTVDFDAETDAAPEADDDKDELQLSFVQAAEDKEAEDFFRNLTEVDDIHRTETPELAALKSEAAQHDDVLPTIDDWRDTSPTIFVNYDAQAAENSFAGRVEPITEEAGAGVPDIFQPVEEVLGVREVQEAAEEISAAAAPPVPVEDFPPAKNEASLCPFCHAENDANAFSCVNCQTVLTISDIEMLLGTHEIDEDIVKRAVASLEAENESYGLGAEQLTSLGLGHINLKNYREGFHYLQEAVRANPNNVVLDAQVNALAIRLSEIEEQQKSTVGTIGKTCTILVVDDSPTVRKLISGKLEKSGHEVICAVDGIDALAKINETVPDLILLDITMPRMDGYQVCKMIRGNDATKDVPVVMISGKDGFFDKVRGKMAGTTGYITKPFGPETLMKTVETYLG